MISSNLACQKTCFFLSLSPIGFHSVKISTPKSSTSHQTILLKRGSGYALLVLSLGSLFLNSVFLKPSCQQMCSDGNSMAIALLWIYIFSRARWGPLAERNEVSIAVNCLLILVKGGGKTQRQWRCILRKRKLVEARNGFELCKVSMKLSGRRSIHKRLRTCLSYEEKLRAGGVSKVFPVTDKKMNLLANVQAIGSTW